jgi:CRISPR-associated protein Csb2
MLRLAIRYLNGWALAAADGAPKEQAEWPPHPDRVFMALAAAWFETGEDPAEGAALRWLEALAPPAIAASAASRRTGVVSYVPVNDTRLRRKAPGSNDLGRLKEAGLGLLPKYRSRQPRGFPLTIPHDPTVQFIWPEAEPGEHRPALTRLASKVTHVGHSASLVQAWLSEDSATATLEPTDGPAEHRLRVPAPGRLDDLARACNRADVLAYADLVSRLKELKGKEKKRVNTLIAERFGPRPPMSSRPAPAGWQGYEAPTSPEEGHPGTWFSPKLVVLSIHGKRVSLPSTLKLTEALRGVLMGACPDQPPPEWLSGHRPDGAPSSEPHLALIPLPFVDAEHADGRVMGLGLALPKALPPSEAGRYLQDFLHERATGLPREHRLFQGRWLECAVELDTRDRAPKSLSPGAWTRASRTWASVTPVVLDRHFDGEDKWQRAGESVKDACQRIGLPRPHSVVLHPVSLVEGVPHARDFPAMTRKSDGGKRYHTHAVILFDQPVGGPVMIGAGRFRGYGLCRPMDG